MANLINVMRESLDLLVERPVLFVPRLASTVLGVAWFIALVEGLAPLTMLALTGPFVALAGLFSSVMMAEIVSREDSSDRILLESFSATSRQFWDLMKVLAILFVAGTVVYYPALVGVTAYLQFGEILYAGIGVSISVILFFLLVFFGYFIPISLVQKGSATESIKGSVNASFRNSGEVVALTLFSFLLLGAVSLIGSGVARTAGYAVFLALRLVSSAVSAYFLVVSPRYYLEQD